MLLNAPPLLLPWLTHSQSLTEKVRELGHDVRVSLLSEEWVGTLFRRDVLIYCNETPCWFGRTIIPDTTFQRRPRVFNGLSNTAIGNVLYHDAGIDLKRRRYFKWKKQALSQNMKRLREITGCQLLWGRASTFHVDELPLFLMEMFLPTMEKKVIYYD